MNELFETMPVKKAYFKIALPVVLSMMVTLVYNLVDTFFVSQTQNTNLVAGVSLCAPIFTLMIALGDIFGLGGSSVISRLFGNKETEEAKRVSAICFYYAIGVSLLTSLIMILFKNPILSLLGTEASTRPYVLQYYHVISLGGVFIILSMIPTNLIRCAGHAQDAMIGTILGCVINIILDPIFLFVFHMEATGVAIATVFSNFVTDVYLIYVIKHKCPELSVSLKDAHCDTHHIKGLIFIGIPASLTNIMQSFAVTLTNQYLRPYGSNAIASMGISLKVNMIIMMVLVGFAFGAQPLIGYCIGAHNKKRLKEVLRFDALVIISFACVMTLVLCLFTPSIMSCFMKDQTIVSQGSTMLRCLSISTPFVGVILILTTLFQSAGYATGAMIISLSRQGVIFFVVMIVLTALLGYMGILLAQCISDIISLIIGLLLVKKMRLE